MLSSNSMIVEVVIKRWKYGVEVVDRVVKPVWFVEHLSTGVIRRIAFNWHSSHEKSSMI